MNANVDTSSNRDSETDNSQTLLMICDVGKDFTDDSISRDWVNNFINNFDEKNISSINCQRGVCVAGYIIAEQIKTLEPGKQVISSNIADKLEIPAKNILKEIFPGVDEEKRPVACMAVMQAIQKNNISLHSVDFQLPAKDALFAIQESKNLEQKNKKPKVKPINKKENILGIFDQYKEFSMTEASMQQQADIFMERNSQTGERNKKSVLKLVKNKAVTTDKDNIEKEAVKDKISKKEIDQPAKTINANHQEEETKKILKESSKILKESSIKFEVGPEINSPENTTINKNKMKNKEKQSAR